MSERAKRQRKRERKRRARSVTPEMQGRAAREALGPFLHGRSWSHVATLTMDGTDSRGRRRHRAQPESLLSGEYRRFIRRLEANVQGPVRHAATLEGVGTGHLHLFVYLADCEALTVRAIRDAWLGGIALVELFDATRSATYATKRVGTADGHESLWASSAELPPPTDLADLHCVESASDASCSMLELLADSPSDAPPKGFKPLPVTRIASLEVVDLETWAQHMARIILRRAGVAA